METKETTFYLVRHGETEWNRDHRMQGQMDSKLTERGKEQALSLREKLRDVHFSRVLSSDLSRTISTARLIIGDSPLEIVTAPALRERNYGPFEGKPTVEYRAEWQKQLEMLKLSPQERWSFRLASGAESNEDIASRFLAYISRAARDYIGETILVVSHGAVIKYSVATLGVARFYDPDLIINNGCYIKIVHDGERFTVTEIVGAE